MSLNNIKYILFFVNMNINIFINIIIFCVILILYLHIRYHLKVNNDIDVFTVNETKKENINEICKLKQPFKFVYNNIQLVKFTDFESLFKNYGKNNIYVKKYEDTQSFPIKLETLKELFSKDASNNYISINNQLFLQETNTDKYFEKDYNIKPNLVSNNKYDLIIGKSGSSTKLKYDLHYRNYLYVTHGKCRVKLFSPQNKKNLTVIKNYETFEYGVDKNPFLENMDGYSGAELVLSPGEILFVPPYWFYSIMFEENTTVCKFNYGTYMSNLSLIPEFIKHFFQKQNIKIKI